MWNYLLQYKGEIIRVLSIFSITMGIVYTFGRILSIVKNNVHKNMIALISIISLNIFYSLYIIPISGLIAIFWTVLLYSSICILLYVLVGFNLYSRADSFLDLKIGKDKPSRK